ncbi:hypothetical protein ACQV5M_22070, partial [Leptospira sp. SA-E8]|uniref:hypothetical protein n=1 Tax=Leptospira sp. SA-E8 TaxID=3422259 RepID=UPI003EBA94DA
MPRPIALIFLTTLGLGFASLPVAAQSATSQVQSQADIPLPKSGERESIAPVPGPAINPLYDPTPLFYFFGPKVASDPIYRTNYPVKILPQTESCGATDVDENLIKFLPAGSFFRQATFSEPENDGSMLINIYEVPIS